MLSHEKKRGAPSTMLPRSFFSDVIAQAAAVAVAEAARAEAVVADSALE
jgi:hypothetical protein